jgi:hypothetical protein
MAVAVAEQLKVIVVEKQQVVDSEAEPKAGVELKELLQDATE